MQTHRILAYALGAILIAAPLPFGSVEPWATGLLVAVCCVVGVVWVVWRSRRGLPALPWKDPVFAAGLLVVLLGAMQTVPLPRDLLGAISPRTVEFRDRYEPAPVSATEDSGRRPISLYPWATGQSTLKFVACWLALLVTLDLASVGAAHCTLVLALVASGGFQAIYGLAEYFSGHQHIFGYSKKFYADVATGTFINRNHFAGYLEMTIPLTIALAAASFPGLAGAGRSLGQRLGAVPGRTIFKSGLLLVLALTMTTALVCSRSRMGIASTLLALITVGWFLAWRGGGPGFILAALLVASVTLLLFSQGGAGDSVVGRFLGTPADIKAGLGRWSLWTQTVGMMRAFPITGVGLGAFPAVFPAFRTSGEGFYLDHAHNDYLEFAAEAGVLGCVILGVAAFLLARTVMRRMTGPGSLGLFGYAAAGSVLAIALHSITDFNLAIPSNALTASVLLGMVICWARLPSPVLAVEREPHRAWIARSLLPAGAIAGVGFMAVLPLGAGILFGSRGRGAEPSSAVAALDPGGTVESHGGLDAFPAWANAKRLSVAAANLGTAAAQDMQVLSSAYAEGQAIPDSSVRYIQTRLRDAIVLQTVALQRNPTSPEEHVALGHLRAAHCAATAMMARDSVNCIGEAMPEFRLALELSPVSTSTRTRVATFLLAAWPLMSDDQRAEARPLISWASSVNKLDKRARALWQSDE
jgi:O-antigen ligase